MTQYSPPSTEPTVYRGVLSRKAWFERLALIKERYQKLAVRQKQEVEAELKAYEDDNDKQALVPEIEPSALETEVDKPAKPQLEQTINTGQYKDIVQQSGSCPSLDKPQKTVRRV